MLPDIDGVDWAALDHWYGKATDVPELWSRLLLEGDPRGEIANHFCHQGGLSAAALPFARFALALALSDHRERGWGLRLLASFLRSGGGPLEQRALLAARPIAVRFKDPITKEAVARTLSAPPPPTAKLEAERRAIARLRARITDQFGAYLDRVTDGERSVREAALRLCVAALEQAIDCPLGEVRRRALEAAGSEDERQTITRLCTLDSER